MTNSFPSTPDMGPGGLTDKDDNYVLQHQDIYALLKYVWTGVLLPVTVPKYQARLQISDSVLAKLTGVITPLVAAHVDAQAHCQKFKDETYPSIVNLASDVYDYAQNAGGTTEDSYYANIFQSIRELADATDEKRKKELRETIDALVDTQVEAIGVLVTKAKKTVADLSTFEDQTKKDESALKDRAAAVKTKLVAELGSLDELEKKLNEYREELVADLKEYEHDKVVALTTLTYFWAGPIGLIAAITTAGIYGDKAAKMAKRIDEVKALIASSEGNIKDEKAVIGDLTAVNAGVDSILKLIGPAIKTIQLMEGIWTSIANDLNNLKDMVNKNVREAKAALVNIVETKMVNKWNTLAESVNKYRQVAYVTEVEQKSLDDLSKQLKELAKKSSP